MLSVPGFMQGLSHIGTLRLALRKSGIEETIRSSASPLEALMPFQEQVPILREVVNRSAPALSHFFDERNAVFFSRDGRNSHTFFPVSVRFDGLEESKRDPGMLLVDGPSNQNYLVTTSDSAIAPSSLSVELFPTLPHLTKGRIDFSFEGDGMGLVNVFQPFELPPITLFSVIQGVLSVHCCHYGTENAHGAVLELLKASQPH